MPPQLWRQAYSKNLERYHADKTAYLATIKGADDAAAQLAVENGELAEDDEEDDDDDDLDADMDADVDDVALQGEIALDGHASVLPPAPPSPRANKRRKSNAGDTAPVADMGKLTPRAPVRETRVLPPGMENEPVAQKAEPKRKKRNARDDADANPPRGEDTERRSKRKRKSESGTGA